MTDPTLSIAALAFFGTAPSAAVASLRHADARRWSNDLVTLKIEIPQGCDFKAVRNFFASLSGLLPTRWEQVISVRGLGSVVVADANGISHYLLVSQSQLDIVTSQLSATLPGVRVTPVDDDTRRVYTLAGELMTVPQDHQLRTDAPESVAASLLAALQPLERDEAAGVQILLSPQRPRLRPPQDGFQLSEALEILHGPSAKKSVPTSEVTKKYAEQLFAATIRLGVRSGSRARDRQLMARLTAAFHAANSPDAHLKRRRTSSRVTLDAIRRRKPPVYGAPCLLNASEIAGLVAWPPVGASLAGLKIGGSRLLPPASDIPSTGIVIAQSNYPGVSRSLALSFEAAYQGLLLTGPPGSGKTSVMQNMALQLMAAGYCCIVIDPKEDFGNSCVAGLPTSRVRSTIVFDPRDSRPIGLAVLRSVDGDVDAVAEQVIAIIRTLNPHSWGPQLEEILRVAVHTAARINGTLIDVIRLLVDATYRASVVGQLDDPLGLEAVWSWYSSLSDGDRANRISSVLNKARPWTTRPVLRHVLAQSDPLLDFDQVLAEGQNLIVPLSSGALGAGGAELLTVIILTKLFEAVMRRARLPKSERRPVFIFIDEAQIVGKLPLPLAEIAAVCRGMNVSLVLAHQTLGQFSPELREILLGTLRSRVIFQTTASDAARFAKDLSPYLSVEDLKGLGPYEIVASLSTGQRVAPPATGKTFPVPPPTANGDAARQYSRQTWGRDRDEIEAELRQRQDPPRGSGPVGRQRRPK